MLEVGMKKGQDRMSEIRQVIVGVRSGSVRRRKIELQKIAARGKTNRWSHQSPVTHDEI